jgi:hypothetical protein
MVDVMSNPIRVLGVAALALLSASNPSSAAKAEDDSATKLTQLLARYDAIRPGAARDQLAVEIDAFAHQRYATVSRLHWHTDLTAAKAAASTQHRPILHLRMLGRLDEDLSCANSRFFRTTLYANAETSKFLRDNFVLYWSSERPVPRVTIDYGDGRKLERTTTGNSAHYVMDAQGNVLDVLPGLYAPIVFRAELAKSLALAKEVRGLDRSLRDTKLVAFHAAATRETQAAFAKLAANTDYIARRGRPLGYAEIGAAAIERAQRASMAKMAVESVDLAKIGIDAGAVDPADVAQWSTIAQKLWNIGLAPPPKQTKLLQRVATFYAPPMLLDPQSIALVEAVRAGNPLAMERPALLARLEQHILADTAQNELRIRPQIRARLGRGMEFTELNDFVYRTVFATPKDDVWLGLLDNTDFTGLPADGVVMP